MNDTINIFIQARMSSSRFPGKMLADLNGQPLIQHIIDRTAQIPGVNEVVVLTSTETSDDPLATYVIQQEHKVFRGNLENVFLRFRQTLTAHPCDRFIRICGDSPLIDPNLITCMLNLARKENCDFLSNVHHKKFPKGQSVEIIKSAIFAAIPPETLTPEQREHVMPYFYEHAAEYKSCFPDYTKNERHINTCIDTPGDLENIRSGQIQYEFKEEYLCQTDN